MNLDHVSPIGAIGAIVGLIAGGVAVYYFLRTWYRDKARLDAAHRQVRQSYQEAQERKRKGDDAR